MKYFELDAEEKKILKDYETGKLKAGLGRLKLQKQYRQYAKGVLDKTKNVNIRISETDLLKIKSLAVKKGIPYQTMLTSLIHQHSNGELSNQQ